MYLHRPAEALPYFEAALEMNQRLFPGDHPASARCLNNVAFSLDQLGRPAEALPKYEAAVEMLQRVFPDSHPLVAASVRGLALSLHLNDRIPDALVLMRREIEMRRRLPDPFGLALGDALQHYAAMLEDAGQLAEAEPVKRQHLELFRRTLPEGDPHLGEALGPLGGLLCKEQKYAEAESLLRECMPLREKLYGPDAPQYWLVFQTRGVLGEAIVGQAEQELATDRPAALARLREAEPLIVESSRWLTTDIERINPVIAMKWRLLCFRVVLERPVRLYEVWDRAEPNAGYADKAAEWRAKLETWQATTRPDATQAAADAPAPASGPAP
jgi:tetratricopeptide (TPR) repeat protein